MRDGNDVPDTVEVTHRLVDDYVARDPDTGEEWPGSLLCSWALVDGVEYAVTTIAARDVPMGMDRAAWIRHREDANERALVANIHDALRQE